MARGTRHGREQQEAAFAMSSTAIVVKLMAERLEELDTEHGRRVMGILLFQDLAVKLGLALALGAFVAGMLVAETEYKHQVETDIRHSNAIVNRFSASDWLLQSVALTSIAKKSMSTQGHVIICGYGRSGQNLARLLEQERIPCMAPDLDPDRVRMAAAAGQSVVSIRRSAGAVVPPDDALVVEGGDTLVLSGLPEALSLAEAKLLGAY